MIKSIFVLLILATCMIPEAANAQGQDSTAGQRYLLIMSQLLPGIWDNANQNYFDQRRGLEEPNRHPRFHTEIQSIDAPALGDHVFLWINTVGTGDDSKSTYQIASLRADAADDEVIMRLYSGTNALEEKTEFGKLTPADLQQTEGCDYIFKRRAAQFRGEQKDDTCRSQWQGQAVFSNNTIELSNSDLVIDDLKYSAETSKRVTGLPSGEPFLLEKARIFHCYVDLPGVGGGRDEPFERYDDITLQDKGGSYWFTTSESTPRQLGITLQSITWHVLNENNGNFNRDSLVVYVNEKLPDGKMKDHGYGFTEPQAERIGVNFKWMLVNCAMTKRDEALPEM